MQQITLRGTHSEMGQQHGAMMAHMPLPPLPPGLLKLADDCEQTAIQHTPELIEEMRAFAAAAHVSYDTLKAFLMAIPLHQSLPSCSVVAVMPEHSANGKLMVGRNYDFAYETSWDSATIYHTYPNNGYAHIANCDIWIGREDGVNEAGLFIAMAAIFLPGLQPGLPFWFIVRHLLEHCATVDEALDWLKSIPHGQSRNYLLADSQQALVVETTLNDVYIREPENGVLVMTNHPIHPTLEGRANFIPETSLSRYNRLRALSDSAVSIEDMQQALNDRKNKVCEHGRVLNQDYGTIWSTIGWPEERRVAIASGTRDNEGVMTYQDYTL